MQTLSNFFASLLLVLAIGVWGSNTSDIILSKQRALEYSQFRLEINADLTNEIGIQLEDMQSSIEVNAANVAAAKADYKAAAARYNNTRSVRYHTKLTEQRDAAVSKVDEVRAKLDEYFNKLKS